MYSDLAKAQLLLRVWIGVYLPQSIASDWPEIPEDPSPPHITLCMVEDVPEELLDTLHECVANASSWRQDAVVTFDRYGEFANRDGLTIAHLVPSSEALSDVRESVAYNLKAKGFRVMEHPGPWKPHATLAYVPAGQTYDGPKPLGGSFALSTVSVVTPIHRQDFAMGAEIEKSATVAIAKSDTSKKGRVSGWFNKVRNASGVRFFDMSEERFKPEVLREGLYGFVKNFREGGEQHLDYEGRKAELVSAIYLDQEMWEAMDVPAAVAKRLPWGAFGTFEVTDPELLERMTGDRPYPAFSVQGIVRAVPAEVEAV